MVRNLTINNHFIPQFYLKNFMDENKELHIYEKQKNIYRKVKNLENTGSKKHLYSIKEKISDKDIEAFWILNPINEIILLKLKIFLNGDFPTELKNENYSTTQEDLFCFYENNFRKVYNHILKNNDFPNFTENYESPANFMFNNLNAFLDRKFYEEKTETPEKKSSKKKTDIPENDYYYFLHYIINQMLRVEYLYNINKKDEITKNISEKHNFSSKNLAALHAHLTSIKIMNTIMFKDLKLLLIENKSKTPFITSDRPVSNTFMHKKTEEELSKTKDLELYFPLSSNFAVLWTENPNYKDTEKITIKKDIEINDFNQITLQNSNNLIFANSEEELRKIINEKPIQNLNNLNSYIIGNQSQR